MLLDRLLAQRGSPFAIAGLAALALFVGSLSSMLTLDWEAAATAESALGSELTMLVHVASSRFDTAAHAALRDPEQLNGEDYAKVVSPLKQLLSAAPTVRYAYTTRWIDGQVVFGVDAAEPVDRDGDGLLDQAALGDVYADAPPELERALRTRSLQVATVPYSDPWGTFVGAFQPLYAADGALECVLAVEYDARAYMGRLHAMDHAANVGIGVAVLASLLIGALVFFVQRQRARIHTELVNARRRAEEANRTKSEFLANMSHEIRTPITSILGYAELVREDSRGFEFGARHVEELDIIVRSGHHLLSVINDILDISKIEAGHVQVEAITTAVHRLVEDTVQLVLPRALERGLTLEVHIDQDVPTHITSDPTRLRQILMNLLSNAVKFTRVGGVCVTVQWIDDADPEPRLLMVVRDTGIGMSDEQLARVFEPFEQADSSVTRSFGGTGLGLPISVRLAEMLGGTLTASSELGIGSTFTFGLRAQPCAPPDPLPAITIGDSCQLAPLQGLRILLVEDSSVNRRLVARVLQREGAQVAEAADGRAAIEALSRGGEFDEPLEDPVPFDVILMDMQMPVLDGFSATRLLRARGSRVPIVALTANAMTSDRAACLEAGCDDFARKPIQRQELVEACLRGLQVRGVVLSAAAAA